MTQKTFLIEICCKMFAPLKRMHCVGLENRQYCYINRVSKTLVSDIHTRQGNDQIWLSSMKTSFSPTQDKKLWGVFNVMYQSSH